MVAKIEQVANKNFDYIIIGGGTAGLTLAAKLSEDPLKSVLVLEEGYDNLNDDEILRPVVPLKGFGNEKYSWNVTTTPQAHLNDRVLHWQRGRGFGGSSNINLFQYTIPPADDIDVVERLGSKGFNWNAFNSALKKIEGFVTPSDAESALMEIDIVAGQLDIGQDGPLKISLQPSLVTPYKVIQETFKATGIPCASKPYNGDPTGLFLAAGTWDPISNTRSYAAPAFYQPHESRDNLTALARAHVHRVITRKDNDILIATGVEFGHEGVTYTVQATKEVIIAAGALHSPKVLELSGIGDRKVLEKAGVPVVLDLPGVGANAQEHLATGIGFELNKEGDLAKSVLGEIAATGAGLRPAVAFTMATLDMVSPRSKELVKLAREKIEANWETYSPGLQRQYEIQLDRLENGGVECEIAANFSLTMATMQPNPAEKDALYLSISPISMHPFSRGAIHIVSSDPAVPPTFDPHYLEESIDLELLVEQLRFIRNLVTLSPLKDSNPKELNPGSAYDTDEKLKEYVKNFSTTSWHTTSTCSMLPLEHGGVVDASFKVYGTSNLRVVDLSVLPLHVAAHTQSVAYGLGAYAGEVLTSH
ncbi:GMC oxidoreductase [Cristinia sonorae]|uniref:GMC oxidoreductase n=1 Tax=Cristinia sonorae TaxID=1940300 RepID=A0A8K0XRD7_9AGAR|nr:GMC oxidoreductase [Cristinia sonorae]